MRSLFVLFLVLFVWGCAQINPLSGGDKDTIAPKIDSSKTFPLNGSTSFSGKKIVLTFDEYIILKNPTENILITPQLKNKPEISAKKKTFTLTFKETLEPNTTYAISFNRAIADYTENNDSVFQYVFSTGNFIDSLSFSGTITDAFSNKPVKDVIVGLYPKSDSLNFTALPQLIKPSYLALTDGAGKYQINYIKAGDYHAFAFLDKDRNLLYNPTVEKLAFSKQTLIDIDSNINSHDLRLYTPENQELKLKSSSLQYPGQLELVFSNPPEDLKISYSSDIIQEKTESNDSLIFWIDGKYDNQTPFVFRYNDQIDTTRLIMKNIPKSAEYTPLKYTSNLHIDNVLPNDTLSLTFSEPISSIDPELIQVFDADSLSVSFKTKIRNLRTLKISSPGQLDRQIQIDSGAIKTFSSSNSNPFINLEYDYYDDKFYGKLILQINRSDSIPIVVELLNKSGELVQSKQVSTNIGAIEFNDLKPNTYQLRLIIDSDKNGIWSTGNFQNLVQPEEVLYYETTFKIRSNWDMEIEWNIDN